MLLLDVKKIQKSWTISEEVKFSLAIYLDCITYYHHQLENSKSLRFLKGISNLFVKSETYAEEATTYLIQKYDQLWFCLAFNASDICVCPNKVVSLLFPVIWHLALFPVRCVHVCHNKVLTSGYVLLLSESKIDGKWRHIPRLIFESKQVNWKQPFPAWNSFQYNRQLLGQITIKVLNSRVSKGYLQ